MIDLDDVKNLVLSGKPIEEILEKINWKGFEDFVTEIFRNNSFYIKKNFRFKTKKRYEIDVTAVKGQTIICVDCKSWSSGRYKTTGLKYAVKDQENRVKELKKFIKKNQIAQNLLKINSQSKFYPLIVTLLEEELTVENNVFIVPVWKLNSFLLEIEKYLN